MFNKFELIGGAASILSMALALYLIQADDFLAQVGLESQTAQVVNAGDSIAIVSQGDSSNQVRANAFVQAADNKGNIKRMVIDDIKIGAGEEVKVGDVVSVHYVGQLQNGQEFDASKKRGEAFEFTVGAGRVIAGWEEGVVGMKVGGERVLVIPPEKAYGEAGIGPIPGNATLVFSIELLGDQVMKKPVTFEILKHQSGTLGRAGVIHTPHGDIETPAYVVVGTKGTVKSLKPEDMRDYVGNQVALANTYHLFLQPGDDVVKEAGGLHKFANWDMPTITDSGGFQVFSLGAAFGKGVTKFAADAEGAEKDAQKNGLNVYSKEFASEHGKLCVIDEEGVTFTSHIDGSMHRFTAERSIDIQHNIGADIIIAFDECTSPTADKEYQREAMERTHRWAKRSVMAHKQNFEALKKQGLYGVVQGGRHLDLRAESARALSDMDFDGFGIGGSFSKADLGDALRVVNEILPEDKPRHLLGIGEPEDIVEGVALGCDTFDCVAPTRIARTGTIYERTNDGHKRINLLNTKYQRDFSKPDESCDCYVCQNYTKAYLAHLFRSREMLGAHLASLHNLYYIVNFTKRLRESILIG